jgi:hypothetical protein
VLGFFFRRFDIANARFEKMRRSGSFGGLAGGTIFQARGSGEVGAGGQRGRAASIY